MCFQDLYVKEKGQPFYIAVEGPDGSGKSTFKSKLLMEAKKYRDDILVVNEPGSTLIGEQIRTLLKDPNVSRDYLTELYLIFAARTELLMTKVAKALREGKLVISDRCYVSTIVYQSLRYGDNLSNFIITQTLLNLSSIGELWGTNSTPYIDKILIMSTPLEQIYQNLENRDGGIIKDGLYESTRDGIKKIYDLYQKVQPCSDSIEYIDPYTFDFK